jgi:WD40 repeat protein
MIGLIHTNPDFLNLASVKKMTSDFANPHGNLPFSHEDGIRSVKLSPAGNYVATGDKRGNLRVYSIEKSSLNNALATYDFPLAVFLEAHDSEILSLDFSGPLNRKKNRSLILDYAQHIKFSFFLKMYCRKMLFCFSWS